MDVNARKLLHRIERNLFIDQLRHDQTKQGAFDKAMWHLDHPIPGTTLLLAPSDKGAGAEKVYAAVEEKPLWLKLWQKARRKLPPRQRAVLDALAIDWRDLSAAKIAGCGETTVKRFKKNFKVHFAQCHQAWKRDLEH